MKAVLAALITVRGIAGFVATLLLALLVWFFAPALLGVRATWLLVLLSLLPLVIWFATMVFLVRRAQKRDAALVAGATQTDERALQASASAAAAQEEEAAVATRLSEALAALKAAGGGKGSHLYERPWYVLIGPPGSGKTTAIRNSGLNFPLAEGRVAGVGGTRNCDWWIAEQGVLIDTAGRYTTQDSDAGADRAGWDRFLELLRRERHEQPLNGIVVAFAADMLSRLDPAGRDQHAKAVRRRVREIEQKLGQRLPVYLLVSKADLIVGFTEFFDDLDRDTRSQVWGMTFPPDDTIEGQVANFSGEYAGLVQRLQDRMLERLHNERGADQRSAIAGFVYQFASLEEPLGAFVQSAFGGSKLDPAPFLRGVYFTSGTQEGTPIDRLTGVLARSFGLDPKRPAAVMGQKGRSYFLGRLLLDVVFNEARLAARDRGAERRRRVIRITVIALSILLLVGGIAMGITAVSRESARNQRVALAFDSAAQAAQGAPLDVVAAHDDLALVLPYLDSARGLAPAAEGSSGHIGLSQEPKLSAAGQLAYRHVLERVLLPRLMTRLETQMRAGIQDPRFLYVATRVYLMLAHQGPLDRALITAWMAADWARVFPGAVGSPTRDRLVGHLDAMLGQDFARVNFDQELVNEARRVLARLPMSERVYARLRGSASAVSAWRPADVLGLAGQRLFLLNTGRPLTEAAVPSLYTVEGFYRSFLPGLPKAILEAASENWVLGPQAATMATEPGDLESAILRMYADDYIREWEKLLGSLELAPFANANDAAKSLILLSAPRSSPMADLLKGIARELSPGTPPPVTASVAGVAGAVAAAATAATSSAASKVTEALGAAPTASPASVVAKTVEDHFRALREAAGTPLDGILAILNDLYNQVARMAASAPGSSPPSAAAGPDVGQRLLAEAERQPPPLSRWLLTAARWSSNARAGDVRASVAAAAGQQLAPFCRGVEARFPFNASPSAPDMPMDDFVRLFGPGGAFDQFFTQNLHDIVDTSRPVWRAAAPNGGPASVSDADIAQFQHAAAIRNAFFPPPLPGQASRPLGFELVPLALDPGATGAVLQVGEAKTEIGANAAGTPPVHLEWPAHARISLSFRGETAPPLVSDGPWAALRLVAHGRLQATNAPDRMRLTLQQGSRWAEFELNTGSIVNPFALPDLARFRCPRLKS